MSEQIHHVFLTYAEANRDVVETLALRLRGDGRLSFWFAPWHSIPGVSLQEQMEAALLAAQSCAIFGGGDTGSITGWQNEQMRIAIQNRVEDVPVYRVIPVLLPGTAHVRRQDLPPFLRRFEPVEFCSLDDERAFRRLLAGILGLPPIEIEGYLQSELDKARLPPPSGQFNHGHAIIIGIANYPYVSPLPETVLNDAHDLRNLLTDSMRCGYPAANVTLLLDSDATRERIRNALADLARCTGSGDTAVVFFSGHGARATVGDRVRQYIVPYDCTLADLDGTAIAGEDLTSLLQTIPVGRLLAILDSCHSGGAADPKTLAASLTPGLGEDYYAALAQGKGRVVIASSRPDEISWALGGMRNSLFTYYILEALRGGCQTLGDGYIHVFDLFRHVARQIPLKANQHPIFKASAMEDDFPVALSMAH